MVKPKYLKGFSVGQSTWVVGESSRGISKGDSRSPMTVAVPKSVGCTSALNSDPFQVALVPESSNLGFIGEEVTNRRKGDKTHTPIAGVLSVGSTTKSRGPGFDVFLIFSIWVLLITIFLLCQI